MAHAPRLRSLASPIVPAVLAMSLYGMYFHSLGIPVVPIAGASILIGFCIFRCITRPDIARWGESTGFLAAALLTLVWLSALVGLLQGFEFTAKAPLGITVGMAILLLVAICGVPRTLLGAINIAALVHVAFLFVQLGYFFTTGVYLDYVALVTGADSRYLYSAFGINLVRTTGLFAEPAALATFAYMLLIVRAVASGWKLRPLDYLLMAAIMVSMSVYGLFLLGMFFVLRLSTCSSAGPRIIAGSVLPVLVGFLLIWQLGIGEYLLRRISNPLDDSSGAVRLIEGFRAFYYFLPTVDQLIGLGMGTENESVGRTNGLYFFLERLGAVAAVVWLLLFALLLKSHGLRMRESIAVFVTFLGAPPVTNLFWWLWLGVLALLATRKIAIPARRSLPVQTAPVSA